MPDGIRTIFCQRIDEFVERTGMSESQLSFRATRWSNSVSRLRMGIGTLATVERVERYMDRYRLADHAYQAVPPVVPPSNDAAWSIHDIVHEEG